jgi:hypothetical protein
VAQAIRPDADSDESKNSARPSRAGPLRVDVIGGGTTLAADRAALVDPRL